MPKQKTHSGLKKRIKVTGTGKVMVGHAYKGHLAASKSAKQNRQLRGEQQIDSTDLKRIKSLISNLL